MTYSGTSADVCAFFRISGRTLDRWNAQRPPRLAFWKCGRHLVYGEEAAVKLRAEGYRASGRLQPGEAEGIARREWREHMAARSRTRTEEWGEAA